MISKSALTILLKNDSYSLKALASHHNRLKVLLKSAESRLRAKLLSDL
jgi:hypothetical protein